MLKESGGWDALPASVKDVRLFGYLDPDTVGIVCSYPKLENLSIEPVPEVMERALVSTDVFNTALLKAASTLRHLDFLTMANTSLKNSFGATKRLHCLSQLPRLENLTIESHALYGEYENIARLPLQDLLPTSPEDMLPL